jgi:tetratricopeptide (TPR) repeat protein
MSFFERICASSGEPVQRRTVRLQIAAIFLVCMAVYGNALFNGFVYDDEPQVIANRWIRDFRYVPQMFVTHVAGFETGAVANYYRPLMHVIYAVTYHIFGLKPWGFHLINLLFHAGASILVFLITSILVRPRFSPLPWLSPALVAALLFATHPIHTEAVTWVASLPEVSFTFFCLLSFYFYLRRNDGMNGAYPLSITSFLVAAFCKETALILPLILIAYDFILGPAGDRAGDRLKRMVPYVVVAGIYLIVRFHALGSFAPLRRHAELGSYQCLINVFPLLTGYLAKLVLPVNLNAFHVLHPLRSILGTKGLLSLTAVAALSVLVFLSFKKHKTVFFLLLLMVVPLLPVLYIPALGENTFAERYLYLPSVGFTMLFSLLPSFAGREKPRRMAALTVVLLALAGFYSIGTVSRNPVWKDSYALWTDTTIKSPDGAIPRTFFADTLFSERGEIDRAIEQYQIAVKLDPGAAAVHNNLGLAYAEKGRIDLAIGEYGAALKLQPDSAQVYNNLGLAYKKIGWLGEAIKYYRIALKLRPDQPGLYYNLANAYEMAGMHEEAEAYRNQAKRLELR